MTESDGQAQPEGPGAKLVAARERAGLTIFQVAERLHLDVESLHALETDRLAIFGAAVFARGHLRRYAELLGIPASDIDAAYVACTRALPPMPNLGRGVPTLAAAGSPTVSLKPGTAVVVAAVLVLAALAWWAVHTPRRSTPVHKRTSVTEPAPPRATAVRQEGQSSASVLSGSEPAAAPAPAAASSAAATPATAATGAVQLSLRFSQDCWAEIYDARGGRLFYELATAGSQRHLSGLAPVRVLLGNPEGVTLELDGRAVPLPSGTNSTPLRFALDSGGHVDVQAGSATGRPATSATNPTPAAAAPVPASPAPQP